MREPDHVSLANLQFPYRQIQSNTGEKTNKMKIRRENTPYSRFLVLQHVNKIHQKGGLEDVCIIQVSYKPLKGLFAMFP